MPQRNPYNQVSRIFHVFSLLANAHTPKTLDDIITGLQEYSIYADDRGMNRRSIQRDIRFLREHMGLRVLNLPGEGYLLDSSANPLMSLLFEAEEKQALSMAATLMAPFCETYLGRAFDRLSEKLFRNGHRHRRAFQDGQQAFPSPFRNSPAPATPRPADDLIRLCITAIARQSRLAFKFHGVAVTAVPRHIEPVHGKMFLVCDRDGGAKEQGYRFNMGEMTDACLAQSGRKSESRTSVCETA